MSEETVAYDVEQAATEQPSSPTTPTDGTGTGQDAQDTGQEAVPAASPLDAFKGTGLVQLPSELWVEIRRVSLTSLLISGRIPDPLLSAAARLADGQYDPPAEDAEDEDGEGDDAQSEEQKRAARQKRRREHFAAMDALVIAVVAKPKLVATEAEETADTVWVGRLVDPDKTQILYYTTLTLSSFRLFRDEYARANTGQDGATVRAKT